MGTENNMDRQADFPYGKIHPLTQPPQSILRSDLISDVIAALGCSDLVLIEGPSGSGKSTLLTQLSDALKSGGSKPRWFRADPFDAPGDMEYFISTLSAEHALIIDDAHLLPNETVNKALIPAFGNIPILATRQEGYPVNESALPEKTYRLGQEKIFFTIAEVAKITEDALNQKNPGLIRCIYDLTQGWPAPTRTLINAIKQARDETEYSENLNLALRALRQFFESEAGSLTDNGEPESPAKRAIANTYHASEDNSSPIYDQYRSYVHLSGLSFDESCQISNDASRANSMPSISARETQILRFLANGDKPNKIAQSLNVSIQTVRAHIRNVYKKLGVHDKGGALDIAIRKRLI